MSDTAQAILLTGLLILLAVTLTQILTWNLVKAREQLDAERRLFDLRQQKYAEVLFALRLRLLKAQGQKIDGALSNEALNALLHSAQFLMSDTVIPRMWFQTANMLVELDRPNAGPTGGDVSQIAGYIKKIEDAMRRELGISA
jgi:uncharacterized membrane protein